MNAIASIFTPRKAEPEEVTGETITVENKPAVDHAASERDRNGTSRRDVSRLESILGADVDHMSGIRDSAPSASPLPDRSTSRPIPSSAFRTEAAHGLAGDLRSAGSASGPIMGTGLSRSRPTAPMAPMDPYEVPDDTKAEDVAVKKHEAKQRESHRSPRLQKQQQNEAADEETEEEEQEEQEGQEKQLRKADDQKSRVEQHYEFLRFVQHRWVDDAVEIQVEWNVGPPTWEPEENLQRDAPTALYKYWREQGGRPANPKNPDFFNVFAIVDHSKDRKKVLVQWTGYDDKNTTWESRSSIEQSAPEAIRMHFKEAKDKPKRGRPKGRKNAARKGVARKRT